MKFFIIVIFVILFLSSCDKLFNNVNQVVIELDNTDDSLKSVIAHHPDSILYVAISAMISPKETFIYYNELLDYLSEKIDKKIILKQRKTYDEVNKMIEQSQVDFAFICSGAYIHEVEKKTIDIIAVPICYDKPFYQSYVIVNKNSNIKSIQDFRNKKIAFTDPMSNTGCLYARKRLKETFSESEIFSENPIYTYAHDLSIQLVQKNIVDCATVDGLIFEYIKQNNSSTVKNIIVIEKSEDFGIPPIVASKNISEKIKQQLKDAFITMHNDSAGSLILKKLLIDRFEQGNDSIYNSIRNINKYVNQ